MVPKDEPDMDSSNKISVHKIEQIFYVNSIFGVKVAFCIVDGLTKERSVCFPNEWYGNQLYILFWLEVTLTKYR